MPRAEIPESADESPDAVSLLTRDHRLVEELFEEFFRSSPQQLDPLARRICKMLRVHTQIEEELFYPAVRRALSDDAFLDHAQSEHDQARQTIVRIESMSSDHAEFSDAIRELQDQIAAHVGQEEGQLFPQVRESGINLVSIGVALAERRDVLLDVLGLHGDDEEGAANQRDVREPGRAARAAARSQDADRQ